MTMWLVRVLRRLAEWLDSSPVLVWPIPDAYVGPTPDEVLTRAIVLTNAAEHMVDVSGEYKRHIVYASLIEEFPRERKRVLAYAIERALQR